MVMTPEQAAEVLREVLPDAYNMSFETSIVSSDITAALQTAIECLTTAHPDTPTPTDEQIGKLFDQHTDVSVLLNPISPTHAMTRTAAIRFARELLKIK